MGLVTIPFMPRSEYARAFAECVERAASEYGMSKYTALLVVESVFEAIASEVAGGGVVRIGGFGAFAAGLRTPRSPNEPPEPYPVPRFSPSKGFRNEVRLCCDASRVRDRELRRHAKRSSPSSRRCEHSAVFTAMAHAKRIVRAQPGCPPMKTGILP